MSLTRQRIQYMRQSWWLLVFSSLSMCVCRKMVRLFWWCHLFGGVWVFGYRMSSSLCLGCWFPQRSAFSVLDYDVQLVDLGCSLPLYLDMCENTRGVADDVTVPEVSFFGVFKVVSAVKHQGQYSRAGRSLFPWRCLHSCCCLRVDTAWSSLELHAFHLHVRSPRR